MGRGRSVWDHPWRAAGVIATVAAVAAWRTTDFTAPPRFDGAGYAVLGESIASGRGYREIDHPDAPRHAHFPPGYPLALAALWRATGGPSASAAHALSLACATGAVVLAWRWFRGMYPPRVAGLLGAALAVNWVWARTAGAIQSEPLFLLLEQLALLAAVRAGRRGGARAGVALGALLAACALTRHVGVALAAAAGLELALRRRWSAAAASGLTAAVLVAPWVVWLATVRENTQAGLVGRGGLPGLIASQAWFYVRRLPDQVTGPFVEIATVFRRSGAVAVAADAWAVLATGLVVFGWTRALSTPRRRLAGLTAFAALGLLLAWPFTEAGRFLIPLTPCVLVGAVEGLARVVPRSGTIRPRSLAASLVLAASLPYAAYALAADRAGAQRRTHAGFDAACAWIVREGVAPGPVLTRHPGEVFWQTGRRALAPPSDDPGAVAQAVGRWGVAYLLVDDDRYANAPENPLSRFVREHPGRVREVWPRDAGRSPVRVFEVVAD